MFHEMNTKPLKITEGDKKDVYKFLWACKNNIYLQNLPKEMIREITAKIYFERDCQVNDVIDVLDTVHKWYPCEIQKVEGNQVYIHYFTWSEKWDEWIDLKSRRLAPLWTYKLQYLNHIQSHHSRHFCQGCTNMKKQFLALGVIETPIAIVSSTQ